MVIPLVKWPAHYVSTVAYSDFTKSTGLLNLRDMIHNDLSTGWSDWITLPETNFSTWTYRVSQKTNRLPATNFQGRAVSFGEAIPSPLITSHIFAKFWGRSGQPPVVVGGMPVGGHAFVDGDLEVGRFSGVLWRLVGEVGGGWHPVFLDAF